MAKMMTVHEVSRLTGVSIRTLHYYDEIGLLVPPVTTEAGYRMYDDTSLITLEDILLFRELEFSLKDIKEIIDNPSFDRKKALENQIELLTLKKKRLDGLIKLARGLYGKGDANVSFDAFDKSRIEAYKKLAKEAWGNTAAYKEYEGKSSMQSDVEKRKAGEDLMNIFYEFGDLKNLSPADSRVQDKVRELQNFITENYYTCTNEILRGLADIYTAGDDMTKNIDAAGGKGCAGFVSDAIKIYVGK